MEFVADGLQFTVQGVDWDYHDKAYLMLHKPAGYECSQKPSTYPSIYTLLPAPIRQRGGGAAAGVQAVGRLDQDTTGLLLLSDDGKFIHRMSSPKHHVPKVYEVRGQTPGGRQAGRANCWPAWCWTTTRSRCAAAACEKTGEQTLRLTLTEGKYHQVKRMIAAVGNRVEEVGGLHRARIGSLDLPADLLPGQWRWLTAQDLAAISA